jgi:hypothetical protein
MKYLQNTFLLIHRKNEAKNGLFIIVRATHFMYSIYIQLPTVAYLGFFSRRGYNHNYFVHLEPRGQISSRRILLSYFSSFRKVHFYIT